MNKDDLNYSAYKYAESNLANLNQVCNPIFSLGVKVFAYFKFFKNGKYLYLCNRLDWLQFCLQNVHNNDNTELGREISNASSDGYYCYLWPLSKSDYLLNALYEFDIWQGLSIFKKDEINEFVELWGFALDRITSFGDKFYLENIELIKKFIAHFNLNMKKFIIHSNSSLATYRDFKEFVSFDNYDHNKILEFIKKTPITKYPLLTSNEEVFITNRELKYINSLSMGQSAKHIALNYSISYRTVEKVIENIKKKIGVNDKESLIKVYQQSVLSWL